MMKWAVILAIGLFSIGAAPGSTLDEAVASRYPPRLSQLAAQHHYADSRKQAYVVTAAAGTEYVIAAYSNSHVGAVVLLKRTGKDVATQQTIRDHQTGSNPQVTAVDLDADGQAEIVVRFELGPRGGSETWIYRLQNGRLMLISPTDENGESLLGFPDILDFEGRGRMDIVDSANVGESRVDPTIVYTRYTLRNGVFVERETLDYYKVFYRANGAPVTTTETLSIPAGAIGKPYWLTVVNGGQNGEGCRTSAGTIALNGVTVSGSNDFSQQRAAWSVSVTLQAENTITVRVEGKPKSRIAVAIRHD